MASLKEELKIAFDSSQNQSKWESGEFEGDDIIYLAVSAWLKPKQLKFSTSGKDRSHRQAIHETNYQSTKRHIRNQFIKELLEELKVSEVKQH